MIYFKKLENNNRNKDNHIKILLKNKIIKNIKKVSYN